MSSLAEKFSTDNAGIAYLISGIGLGRLISILFFGVISDKFGRRAVILMAVIMYLLFFFIPACPNLTLAYGLAVCVGIANSALDTGGYPRSWNAFRKPLVRRSYWLKRWCHLGKCSTQCWWAICCSIISGTAMGWLFRVFYLYWSRWCCWKANSPASWWTPA